VLLLSDLLGRRVCDSAGTGVGRLVDLSVGLGEDASVTRLAVGRGRRVTGWADWSQVDAVDDAVIRLLPGARLAAPDGDAHRGGQIRLARDVLDTQILDSSGTRLVRAADVVLTPIGGRLEVVAVELGVGSVVRRLGFRRLGQRMPVSVLDWHDLQPASTQGLAVQLRTSANALKHLRPAELATVLAGLGTDRAVEVLETVDAEEAAAALSAVHPDVSARLLQALPEQMAASLVEHMALDDAAASIRWLPAEDLQSLLSRLGSARAETLRRLVAAPPDTAGGLMNTDVRMARPGESLEDIRARLAADPPRLGSLATVFVVDEDRRPLGVIDVVSLITGRVHQPRALTIPVDLPVDDVIDFFATHDFLAVPVVDDQGRLVGAVAVDDVLEELLARRLPGARRFAHLRSRRLRLPPRASRRVAPRRPPTDGP